MTAAVPEIRAAQVRDVTAIAAIDPRAHHRAEEIRALVREHASLVAVDGGLFFHDPSTEESLARPSVTSPAGG